MSLSFRRIIVASESTCLQIKRALGHAEKAYTTIAERCSLRWRGGPISKNRFLLQRPLRAMLAMMAMAKLFSAELREEALRLLCPRHKDVKPKFCSADDVPRPPKAICQRLPKQFCLLVSLSEAPRHGRATWRPRHEGGGHVAGGPKYSAARRRHSRDLALPPNFGNRTPSLEVLQSRGSPAESKYRVLKRQKD